MKFGVNTMIWSGSIDGSIPMEAIKNAQVDVIEVPVFDVSDIPIDFLRKSIEEFDFECTFCAVNPPGKNPISDDGAPTGLTSRTRPRPPRTVRE